MTATTDTPNGVAGSTGPSTRILPVDPARIGRFNFTGSADSVLDSWEIDLRDDTTDAANLKEAAERLCTRNIPVAFPTETVYGLGADATRSLAVQGIYKAKQRPSDNPLIVHFCSLEQLRDFLQPARRTADSGKSAGTNGSAGDAGLESDPIPSIYKPLIRKFWPGPLTILLPNPANSSLAPEVTAGLDTFGARMPKSILALALIKLAGAPLAAPSANASTKPSPTTAEHVKYDLDGRIDVILDGGPSDVGVESTVVDGLSNPPLILRPGGISIEQLRDCPGWENVEIGYKDSSEKEKAPRAPGMKYRHYSPKATVVLFEAGSDSPTLEDVQRRLGPNRRIGSVRTKTWKLGFATTTANVTAPEQSAPVHLHDIHLGAHTDDIARGLFSALRELDKRGVDAIFVEGVSDEHDGSVAAAVMNRLRKAAEFRVY
ncbi:translation factor [Xylona heveae TC161]|uniref:Threonylcarbamoyl-AMP synthase n=1 Tax=Xylona heveae (strain CBS 132557 / TC161) TaxID=1328760 RepID=A0A165IZQ5_XYLHT|nr:translation factor [Xylona heveae TC161]KZF25594.1 translation factor [Xylona heveae TC161]